MPCCFLTRLRQHKAKIAMAEARGFIRSCGGFGWNSSCTRDLPMLQSVVMSYAAGRIAEKPGMRRPLSLIGRAGRGGGLWHAGGRPV